MFLKISSFFPHNESQELSWESQRTPKSKLNRNRFCKPNTQLQLPLRKFIAANLEHQQFSDRVSSSYTWPPLPHLSLLGSSVLSTTPLPQGAGNMSRGPRHCLRPPLRPHHHSVQGHFGMTLLKKRKETKFIYALSKLSHKTRNTQKSVLIWNLNPNPKFSVLVYSATSHGFYMFAVLSLDFSAFNLTKLAKEQQ